MKYGMVSMLIPKEYEDKFRLESRCTMQDAANALQWNLYEGLSDNLGKKFPLFNLLPCGSFPQYCKKAFIPQFDFDEKGKNLGFCNVKLIRNYFRTNTLKKELIAWCNEDKEPKTLFVYTISQPLLSAVATIKKRFNNIHICAIVADLPDMSNLSSKQSRLLKLFASHKAKGSYALLSVVDSFVLLTKHMAEYMHLQQPFCVIEGIAPKRDDMPIIDGNKEAEKIILYTGTLHRKFGILHLLEAFRHISDEKVRLIVCGIGDSEAEIRRAAAADPRICFLGQQSRAEVLKLQQKSTVLVNPRLNNERFTKYSFPSKNLEYLSSGVPLVAYKLDGIPDEYDEYIIYPSDDTPKALAHAIQKVCRLTSIDWQKIGQNAANFVAEQKNSLVQAKRILRFVDSIHLSKKMEKADEQNTYKKK